MLHLFGEAAGYEHAERRRGLESVVSSAGDVWLQVVEITCWYACCDPVNRLVGSGCASGIGMEKKMRTSKIMLQSWVAVSLVVLLAAGACDEPRDTGSEAGGKR